MKVFTVKADKKMTLEEANKKLEKEIGKLIKKGQAMDK